MDRPHPQARPYGSYPHDSFGHVEIPNGSHVYGGTYESDKNGAVRMTLPPEWVVEEGAGENPYPQLDRIEAKLDAIMAHLGIALT